MPEMNLRQPGFTVLMDHLQKSKERIQKFNKTGDSIYIYIYIYTPKRTR